MKIFSLKAQSRTLLNDGYSHAGIYDAFCFTIYSIYDSPVIR